jgi:SAM-dependent methyltransferase
MEGEESSGANTIDNMNADQKLHASLREFYNRDFGYFEEAGEANAMLTPERRELFAHISDGSLVLDVGSGGCENALFLGGRVRYVGCDVSSLALERARTLGRPLFGGVRCESQALPFRDGSFDVALSTYALEHFVFPEESLREMWRVCRTGGRVILISPAYDDPRELPPSVGHWPVSRRIGLAMEQAIRQTVRHVSPRQFYFSRVRDPRVLRGEYRPDFDAVHLVSAREIANFFTMLGGKILFERKRLPRNGTGFHDALRNCFLRLGIGEYAGLNLQIVIEKP